MYLHPTFRRALALSVVAGGVILANVATASAQPGSDACPGPPGTAQTYPFDGIPTSSDELLPSVLRSMSILGLLAKNSDCALRVTCVSPSAESDARRDRNRQCSVARFALFAYERRSTVRNRLRDELDVVRLDRPSDGLSAGRVYVTLIAQ